MVRDVNQCLSKSKMMSSKVMFCPQSWKKISLLPLRSKRNWTLFTLKMLESEHLTFSLISQFRPIDWSSKWLAIHWIVTILHESSANPQGSCCCIDFDTCWAHNVMQEASPRGATSIHLTGHPFKLAARLLAQDGDTFPLLRPFQKGFSPQLTSYFPEPSSIPTLTFTIQAVCSNSHYTTVHTRCAGSNLSQ